jgi:hypothetical protein
MTQEIITYIILVSTAGYVAYKMFFNKSERSLRCGGCESGCSGCELTKLKTQIKDAQKKQNIYQKRLVFEKYNSIANRKKSN